MSETPDLWAVPFEAKDEMSRSRFPLKERGRFAEEHPESADAWTFFAHGDISCGAYEDAIKHSTRAIGLNPKSARAWFWKVFSLAMIGDREGAKATLVEAERSLPDDPDIWASRGGILTLEGKYQEAEELLKRTRDADPSRIGHWTAIAYLQMLAHQVEFQETLDEVNARFPEHVDSYLLAGRARLKERNFARAEEQARFAVASGPESASAWALLSQAQTHQGRLDEGERSARQALDINPRKSEAWAVLARIASERGDHAEAARCREQEKKASRYLKHQELMRKAIDAVRHRRYGEARNCANHLLESAEARLFHGTARALLLQCAFHDKRFEEAESLLSEMKSEGGANATWYEGVARLHIDRGDYQEGLRLANEALVAFPIVGTLHALRIKAAKKSEDPNLKAYVEEAVSSGYQGPADGAQIAIALDEAGFAEQSRQLTARLRAKFPDAKTVELVDAAQSMGTNFFGSLGRISRLNQPQFRSVSLRAQLTMGLVVLLTCLSVLVILPFVLLRKLYHSLSGQGPTRPRP